MTISGITVSMTIIWLALAVIFLAVEAATVGLTTIWFAAGALIALILSLLDFPIAAQVIVFLAVSLFLLVFTRKIFVEKLKTGSESTNADALIGEIAEVIAPIAPHKIGQVRVRGQEWSAVCRDNALIESGTLVKVIAIEGVKLIVAPTAEG